MDLSSCVLSCIQNRHVLDTCATTTRKGLYSPPRVQQQGSGDGDRTGCCHVFGYPPGRLARAGFSFPAHGSTLGGGGPSLHFRAKNGQKLNGPLGSHFWSLEEGGSTFFLIFNVVNALYQLSNMLDKKK